MIQQIEIEGWKGKDEISINKVDLGYEVVEHRKDKETGDVKTSIHFVKGLDVANLMTLIERYKEVNYRDLVKELITEFNLNVSVDAFNGGKNRAKYYFPLYYYPLKVLEAKGKIEYSGRGKIRLK